MDNLRGDLGSHLPPNEAAELLEAHATQFRAAALALTGLFKHGKKAATKAYLAGQKQAFQEVLEFVQAGLDHPQASSSSSGFQGQATAAGSLDVARLINFVCARQEAVKAEDEDLDDDEPSSSSHAVPPPPRRAASAAPAPPSPLRPGMLPRASTAAAASTSHPPPPRPVSAAPPQAASYQLRNPPPHPSSAPTSPQSSSAFSPQLSRPSGSFLNSTSAGSSSFTAPASPSPLHAPTPSSNSAATSSATLSHPAFSFGFGHLSGGQAFAVGAGGGGGGGSPSPLSRASSHPRSLRSRASNRGAAKSGASTPSSAAPPSSVGGSEGEVDLSAALGAGMKRRWAAAGMPSGVAGGDSESAHEVVELDGRGAGEDESTGMDVEPLMEGWDGVGERPFKRVARSGRSTPGGVGGGEAEGEATQ